MSKHDSNPFDEVDPDLLHRTEKAILALMDKNGGKMPVYNQVNDIVRTSMTKLAPAMRLAKDKILAIETRLANMPDMPDELRLAHDQALKDIWAKARDYQQAEIADLKRGQEMKDARYRDEQVEAQMMIAEIEAKMIAATSRAESSEKLADERLEELSTALASLASAQARLDERDAILDMIRGSSSDASDEEIEATKSTRKKSSRVRKSDEPETGDLPGFSSGPSDAPEPS